MRINQASAVLLAECGLLTKDEARAILGALGDILETIDLDRLVYTGEHEDFFFYVEAELIRRLAATSPASSTPGAAATTSTTPCSSWHCKIASLRCSASTLP
jgi:hypothetical protein